MVRFNNHRTLQVKERNVSYISHNLIMLNDLMKKRFAYNNYKYVAFQGGVYEIDSVHPIHGGTPKIPLKEVLDRGIMIACYLGKKVA